MFSKESLKWEFYVKLWVNFEKLCYLIILITYLLLITLPCHYPVFGPWHGHQNPKINFKKIKNWDKYNNKHGHKMMGKKNTTYKEDDNSREKNKPF